MNRLMKFLLIFTLIIWMPLSQAGGVAGRVIMVRGEAQATNIDGEVRQLKRRDMVYSSDVISTGDNSRVQIRFVDKGMLALRANSKLNIKTYRQPSDASDEGEVLMELIEGGFRTLTGSIGKGDKEAYKVDTPVASIGIRGTVYRVALVTPEELYLGVSSGGITVNSSLGQMNLGMGADFDFALVDGQGVQGLLSAPDALQQPAQPLEKESESSDSDNEQQVPETDLDDEQAPEADQTVENPSIQQTELPNGLDKEQDSGSEEQLTQQVIEDNANLGGDSDNSGNPDGGNGERPELASPDQRLSDSEYAKFLNSDQYGAFIINNKVTPGTTFIDERGQTVFVSLKEDADNALDVTRFTGISTSNQPIANVSWGVWNDVAEGSIEQYRDSQSTEHVDLQGPAVWIKSKPVRITDLIGLSGTISFAGNGLAPATLNGTLVENTTVSGSFDLNLTSGAVSNGNLQANFNGDLWNASFSGDIRPGNATQNTPVLDLDVTNGSHGGISLDLNNSEIGGVLTAPASAGGIPGVAGGFQLQDTAETPNTATGLIAWPGAVNLTE